MNLRHLRAFATIADAGGFARAATRLNLSQPALSRQIHALEHELGVLLFDRVGRRVQLTSEGEDLLGRSRHLLAESDALAERARTLKGGETGILRIGATPQVIENLLAPFLTIYGKRHPGVEIRLIEDGGVRLPERLERGHVHLAFASAPAPGHVGRALYPMYVLAVLASTHRLGRSRSIEVESLADEPLLLLDRAFGSRDWFEAACSVAHIRPRVLLESAAPHTLVALAATGYGVAILPSNATILRHEVHAVPVVHRGAPVGRWAHIAWNPQRFLAPYAMQFVEEIVRHCRRDFAGRDLVRRAPPLPRPRTANGG